MYNCTVKFYFVACPESFVRTIKAVPALPCFRHEFISGLEPDDALTASADVIIASSETGQANLATLAKGKKNDAALLLALREEDSLPDEMLWAFTDIWRGPLNEAAIKFHFDRWLDNYMQKLKLKETRHFLDSLMDASPNLIWFKNKDGVHELVNNSFCKTVEKTKEQVQGQKHAYIWNVEKDDPACLRSENIVMESRRTNVFEEIIETGAGKRVLTTYKSPLFNIDGSLMGTLGIGVDITREREYQTKLVQNNKALEALFTTMDCGIICHTPDGSHVISANNAALKLLDFSSMDELESGFHILSSSVMEIDKPKLLAAINGLKNIGDSTTYEYRIVHKDGSLIHVMGNAKLVEKDGEVICQRFLLDCTAQKLAEEKEKIEKERRHKELVRALSVDYQLVCILDPRTGGSHVLQLLDYPDKNLKRIFSGDGDMTQKIENYIKECAHPEDRDALRQIFCIDALKNELATKRIAYYNYRSMQGNIPHYFQLKAVRADGGDGSFGLVVGLQSVDSRTRQELEQKNQLAEALKQATKASRAKSIFLSNMSHDIRTPMNAVVGYTSLALTHLDKPAQVKNYLNKILASGKYLISLINDILDMSYIESGKIQLEHQLYNLEDILGELWNIVQPAAKEKKQTLNLDMDNVRNKEIVCDKLRLKQILLNLLSNAIKYTPEGGEIDLSILQKNCPNHGHAAYEFHVRDNGIGMNPEFISRLFEPFERALNTTMAGIQGTGLGMAITKNIVDMMKGEIDVHSKVGEGSEFVFRVVFKIKAEADAKDEPGSEAERNGLPAKGKSSISRSYRILLAEDNEMNQEIACEFLTGANYQVDVANNGREAIDRLKSVGPGYYDVVLMDVQMPVMDGYEATESIRALPDKKLANIPIIAMTANSFEEDRQQALMRGMNAHIAKPIDFSAFFSTLDNLLG